MTDSPGQTDLEEKTPSVHEVLRTLAALKRRFVCGNMLCNSGGVLGCLVGAMFDVATLEPYARPAAGQMDVVYGP